MSRLCDGNLFGTTPTSKTQTNGFYAAVCRGHLAFTVVTVIVSVFTSLICHFLNLI